MRETAEKTAGDNNVELLTATGTSDVDSDSQVAALEDMTRRGAKGILIAPAARRRSCRRSRRRARPASP